MYTTLTYSSTCYINSISHNVSNSSAPHVRISPRRLPKELHEANTEVHPRSAAQHHLQPQTMVMVSVKNMCHIFGIFGIISKY